MMERYGPLRVFRSQLCLDCVRMIANAEPSQGAHERVAIAYGYSEAGGGSLPGLTAALPRSMQRLLAHRAMKGMGEHAGRADHSFPHDSRACFCRATNFCSCSEPSAFRLITTAGLQASARRYCPVQSVSAWQLRSRPSRNCSRSACAFSQAGVTAWPPAASKKIQRKKFGIPSDYPQNPAPTTVPRDACEPLIIL